LNLLIIPVIVFLNLLVYTSSMLSTPFIVELLTFERVILPC
jgi:hypothetical protein